MKQLRLIFLLFLSMALGLGETSAAYSQAQMAGSRSLTICSSYGSSEVRIGANGKPLSSNHHSHSCCLFVSGPLPDSVIDMPLRIIRRQALVYPTAEGVANKVSYPPKARSPPFVV